MVNPVALGDQSGCLTIKSVRKEKTEDGVILIMTLGVPNNEVRRQHEGGAYW